MIAETDPKSPIAESFDLIARMVTGRAEVRRPKRSALAPLIARFAGKKSA
jgi:pilus assembly protein CpaE